MKPIITFESPHIALVKSAATAVLAKQTHDTSPSLAIDVVHPVIAGINRYAEVFVNNQTLQVPASAQQAVLKQLHNGKIDTPCDDSDPEWKTANNWTLFAPLLPTTINPIFSPISPAMGRRPSTAFMATAKAGRQAQS